MALFLGVYFIAKGQTVGSGPAGLLLKLSSVTIKPANRTRSSELWFAVGHQQPDVLNRCDEIILNPDTLRPAPPGPAEAISYRFGERSLHGMLPNTDIPTGGPRPGSSV